MGGARESLWKLAIVAVGAAMLAVAWPAVAQTPRYVFERDRSVLTLEAAPRSSTLPEAWSAAIEQAWRATERENVEYGICLLRTQGPAGAAFSAEIQRGEAEMITLRCPAGTVGSVHTHPPGSIAPYSTGDIAAMRWRQATGKSLFWRARAGWTAVLAQDRVDGDAV